MDMACLDTFGSCPLSSEQDQDGHVRRRCKFASTCKAAMLALSRSMSFAFVGSLRITYFFARTLPRQGITSISLGLGHVKDLRETNYNVKRT